MSSNIENALGGKPGAAKPKEDVNPIKSDPELQGLLRRLDKVKKYKTFQRWKAKFLDRLEQFLYEAGMKPAEQSCNKFATNLKSQVTKTSKVQDFIDKGELSDERKTVKASLALNEMCKNLTDVTDEVAQLIPKRSTEEKKKGFTKFHLGAALIRQGFHQYITMEAIKDALKVIGTELEHVADRQQHELFDYYNLQVQRFCDVMADLSLYEIMLKCVEFQDAPEEEESSDEEPVIITVVVETESGKSLSLKIDPADTTFGDIKKAIASDCGIVPDKQVLKVKGSSDALTNDGQTLAAAGMVQDTRLTVEPFRIPITVKTHDGKTIEMKVDPNEYMSDLKISLQDESGIPARNQRLYMAGEELDNDFNKVSDYDIKPNSVLDLEPKSINVHVELPDGKVVSVQLKTGDTRDEIKEKIEAASGMPVSQQVLKYQGTEVPNDSTVKDLGLKEGGPPLTVDLFQIPIIVNTADGKKIKMMIDPMDYLSDIKIQLQDESGIPAKNQRLMYAGNGQELDDDMKKMADYGIKANTELDLMPKIIKVNVTMPDGKTVPLELRPTDSIESIKSKIEAQTGLAMPQQILKREGTELPNGETVKGVGIKEGDTLSVDLFKVPVTVNTMDGKTLEIMVDPTDYLSDIKVQLQNEGAGIPAKNQELSMNGQVLDDDSKKAQDYGIKGGSVLYCEPKTMHCNVNTPDGKTYSIEIKPNYKLDDIKKAVADKTGMEVPKQVLKLEGKELPDGKTVKEMGIQDGSTLDAEIFRVPVTVNTMDGKTLEIMVDPTDCLSDIKKQLQDEGAGIPANNQELSMNGQVLGDDSKKAKDYGITEGSVLYCEPKTMHCNVNTPDGKTHSIEIKPNYTLDNIKKAVADKTGMSVPQQILKFEGKELPDGKTVKDMGIQDGSTLDAEIFRVPVTVNTMDGKTLEVMMDPTDYLSDIKKQLQNEGAGIPAENQELSMDGQVLDDDSKKAQDYGIKGGSVLYCEPKTMHCKVNTPDGKTHSIEIKPSDTLDDIKKAVAAKTGMEVPKQLLKFEGKELPKGKTVKEMGIQDGSTLDAEIFKVPVTVNCMDGTTIKAMVDPTNSLLSIKKQLENESGLPASNQKLFMNGKELNDDAKTAKDYGIVGGSVLDLQPKKMMITVDTPDGQTHSIEIKPEDTADDIKVAVQKQTGLEPPKQVLKLEGKELPNGKSAKEMGIQDGSALTAEIFKVPITVRCMDGNTIKALIDPTDPLYSIKKQIENESGVPANNQKMFMDGQELDDDKKKASDYGIKKGSIVDMEPKEIQVNVEMPDGASLPIAICPSDTAETIKDKIAHKTGFAAPRQVLKFEGKEIPKGKRARDMGIQEGSPLKVGIFKVPVTVNTMDGRQIKVMVDPGDKLGALKQQLEEESGFSPKNQRLFMDGQGLNDDNKTAGDYGIKSGSVLDLEPVSISVRIVMPDNSVHSILVKPSDTADGIKAIIEKDKGLAKRRQVLQHEQKEVPNQKTVREMRLADGSALKIDILKIPITVKTYDDDVFELQIEPIFTINDIKKMIQEKTDLEPKKQALKLDGEELKNGSSTAENCGIKARSHLTMDMQTDPIIFVDVKCGTLFGMERDDVIEKKALTPNAGNKMDFLEATTDSATREKICNAMKGSPKLGVATQVVVLATEVEDYEMQEAEKVKNMWGVTLKKKEKNVKGEEFIFIDPKTGACGELSRKKYIDMGFITVVPDRKGGETLAEYEKDGLKYDKYIHDIRKIFGIKVAN